MMHDTVTQPDMEPSLPRRQSSTHAWGIMFRSESLPVDKAADCAWFTGPGLSYWKTSKGQRWVHLKRSIRLFASSRVLAAAKMRRQALTALEADSRAAQAQYETHPTDAGALLQWRQAHHTLQQLNAGVAQAAALQAGVVWQHYGEQSTFWFYHLAREIFPPREGGLHVRLSHRIVHHAMAKQLPLS